MDFQTQSYCDAIGLTTKHYYYYNNRFLDLKSRMGETQFL